jgi:hypothetical protein
VRCGERALRKREMLNSLLGEALRSRGLGVLALRALVGLHTNLDGIGAVDRPAVEPVRPAL